MRVVWCAMVVVAALAEPARAQRVDAPLAAPGQSQDRPAATAGDPIVVTGRPLPPKEEIRALARAITPPNPSDAPLPRFHDSVCFGSAGLDRPTLEAIGDRLAADAEQAGLTLAGDGCKPNVITLFVDHVESEVAKLVQTKWWVFGDRSPGEIRSITREKGPVRAWSNSETRSRDGDQIDSGGFLKVATASRVVASVRRDTLASIVLIERAALLGKSPRQIGDYVAMRALAGVRPQRVRDRETILTLFDSETTAVPAELTAFDRGYLHGLYAGAANAFASSTQGTIVREILKAKGKEEAPAARNGSAVHP